MIDFFILIAAAFSFIVALMGIGVLSEKINKYQESLQKKQNTADFLKQGADSGALDEGALSAAFEKLQYDDGSGGKGIYAPHNNGNVGTSGTANATGNQSNGSGNVYAHGTGHVFERGESGSSTGAPGNYSINASNIAGHVTNNINGVGDKETTSGSKIIYGHNQISGCPIPCPPTDDNGKTGGGDKEKSKDGGRNWLLDALKLDKKVRGTYKPKETKKPAEITTNIPLQITGAVEGGESTTKTKPTNYSPMPEQILEAAAHASGSVTKKENIFSAIDYAISKKSETEGTYRKDTDKVKVLKPDDITSLNGAENLPVKTERPVIEGEGYVVHEIEGGNKLPDEKIPRLLNSGIPLLNGGTEDETAVSTKSGTSPYGKREITAKRLTDPIGDTKVTSNIDQSTYIPIGTELTKQRNAKKESETNAMAGLNRIMGEADKHTENILREEKQKTYIPIGTELTKQRNAKKESETNAMAGLNRIMGEADKHTENTQKASNQANYKPMFSKTGLSKGERLLKDAEAEKTAEKQASYKPMFNTSDKVGEYIKGILNGELDAGPGAAPSSPMRKNKTATRDWTINHMDKELAKGQTKQDSKTKLDRHAWNAFDVNINTKSSDKLKQDLKALRTAAYGEKDSSRVDSKVANPILRSYFKDSVPTGDIQKNVDRAIRKLKTGIESKKETKK